MKRVQFLILLLVLSSFTACRQAPKKETKANPLDDLAFNYTSNPTITVDSAAVVSAHPLASEVGKYILQQGGNAVDASIAIQYALAVVYPGAGNIGGGGFMVFTDANGNSHTIDFRETAPGAADRDMYLDEDGNVIENASWLGALAVGVPGTVAGAELANKKYGKLPMDELIRPAIQLARKGFVITKMEAHRLNDNAESFRKQNGDKKIAFLRERPWREGDTLIQPELANTLERIAKNGAQEFYTGETAKMIVKEIKKGNGIITLEDLENYKPVERKAREFDYKGEHVVTMDLPSSGGLMIQMMLKMLEPYDLAEMGFHSPEAINHIVEVERRAYADRTDYMGDPDFVDVPVAQLLDDDYLKNRMKDFVPGKAGSSTITQPGLKESEETTHLSVLDKDGNAVAVTTTLNGGYGSHVVVDGAGFFLNNEMDDFSAKPGYPNAYGLMGTEANKIEPHKRMLSSMTPTIVLKEGKPHIVVGTPGGSTIITSVLQSILNVMAFDLSAEDAVNKPKFHHQWEPDKIFVEDDFPKDVIKSLEAMGYEVETRGKIGRTEMILVGDDGKLNAAADQRGDDSAAGY